MSAAAAGSCEKAVLAPRQCGSRRQGPIGTIAIRGLSGERDDDELVLVWSHDHLFRELMQQRKKQALEFGVARPRAR